jgi:hypothetical protein
MSYQPTTPYYSRDSEIFHNCKNCTRGDKIESDKLEKGEFRQASSLPTLQGHPSR